MKFEMYGLSHCFSGKIILLLFLLTLVCVAHQDMRARRIRDCWHAILLMLAALAFLAAPEPSAPARIAGSLCVSAPLLLICMLRPDAFGGGDIKLSAAGGLFLGWRCMLVSAVIAVLAGGAWACYLLLFKKKGRKESFAFGPFLCLGMAVGVFAGDMLAAWFAAC